VDGITLSWVDGITSWVDGIVSRVTTVETNGSEVCEAATVIGGSRTAELNGAVD